MNGLVARLGCSVATLALAAACGGQTTAVVLGGAGGEGGGDAVAASSTAAGLSVGCGAPCEAGTFCSVSGACITDGTCAASGDCDEGLTCDEGAGTCVPGGGCGAFEVAIDPVAPNLMLVLDRSCSMRRDLANALVPAGPNKWTFSVDAITELTTAFEGDIRFGLILFPNTMNPNCQQAEPAFPVATGQEPGIRALLAAALAQGDANFPDGPCVTNIDTAVEQAAAEPAFLDPERSSYAALITDGKQAGCNAAGGDNGTEQILAGMFAAGVPTFVVGFGGGVDPNQMNEFAEAGGVPLDGETKYYQADDAQQLEDALDAIAKATLGCVFALAEAPPAESDIYVFFDNDPSALPRNPDDGWQYDAATNQVEIFGSFCEALQSGAVTDVDIVFGCPAPTPQ